jgi:hypothetical protein
VNTPIEQTDCHERKSVLPAPVGSMVSHFVRAAPIRPPKQERGFTALITEVLRNNDIAYHPTISAYAGYSDVHTIMEKPSLPSPLRLAANIGDNAISSYSPTPFTSSISTKIPLPASWDLQRRRFRSKGINYFFILLADFLLGESLISFVRV